MTATNARSRVRFMPAGIDVARVVRLLNETDGSEMENPVHRCQLRQLS